MRLLKNLSKVYVESPILLLLAAMLVGLIVMLGLHVGGDYVRIGIRLVMLANLAAFPRYVDARRTRERPAESGVGGPNYRNLLIFEFGLTAGVVIYVSLRWGGFWG